MGTKNLDAKFKFPTIGWRFWLVPGFFLGILLLTLASTAQAHHSWGAVYNDGAPVSTTAVLTSKAYRNPHDRVEATIVNQAGEAEDWMIEWRGRRGGRGADRAQAVQYDLMPGDEVTIEGVIANIPGRKSIQITKLTRISDGMTIEASLTRGNGEGRGERRRGNREGGRRGQSAEEPQALTQ